jgi:AcrR family transcriptional regulator
MAAVVRDTRTRLLTAAAEALRDDGVAGISARVIAARAGVNQALVFYHFGTVSELVAAATRDAVDARLELYRDDFAAVGSLPELLRLGRALHERERQAGNVRMMAQLMAGAHQDAALATAGLDALEQLGVLVEVVDELGPVARRALLAKVRKQRRRAKSGTRV